ncbi:MAG TPA: hypothetical protein VH442_18030, partial [Micromonosporaceae bacterium]
MKAAPKSTGAFLTAGIPTRSYPQQTWASSRRRRAALCYAMLMTLAWLSGWAGHRLGEGQPT